MGKNNFQFLLVSPLSSSPPKPTRIVIKFISIRHKVIIKQDNVGKKGDERTFLPSRNNSSLTTCSDLVEHKKAKRNDDKIHFSLLLLCASTDESKAYETHNRLSDSQLFPSSAWLRRSRCALPQSVLLGIDCD